MEFLIRLKAWQVLLLILFPAFLSNYDSLQPVIWTLMVYVIYWAWIYAIGIKMNSFIPANLRPGLTSFKIHSYLLLIFLITLFAAEFFGQLPDIESPYAMYFGLGAMTISLYLLFNVWMFSARMLESVIVGTIVNRSDSLKAFLCFWFFPIGIWFIQPAVNRAVAKYAANNAQLE
ncbi:MAG: hypothetical protein V4577_04110 [Bacteroidota bacterium]